LLVTLAPGLLQAEPGAVLRLKDAVELARSQNPMIRESEANREAARAARREAWLYRLPAVTARETFVRTNSPADVFGMQLMQERFSFPAFTQSDPNDPDLFNNYQTQLEARLPIFTGGALSGGIRQASRMADAADAVRGHTVRAVDLGVTQAYVGTLLADRFVALAEKARETTARHVEKAQAFYDVGFIVESDLLQARVQLARMEENLVRARNGERLARAGLNRAMGVNQTLDFTLEEPSALAAESPTSLDEALAEATRNRLDLRAADRRVEAMRAGVTRARGEYFPQLGVAGRLDWNDDSAFGDHGDSYTLMARAEWNVWNWGQTQARVARSKHEAKVASEARRAYADQVEFEARQAWQAVEEARARCAVTGDAVGAAERALSILEDRFAQGVARMTDLLDMETMAHEARVRDAQAKSDLQIALRTLAFATGGDPVPEVNS
jgi:outer membrane protein TolC